MPTDTTLEALRDVGPRNQPGFVEWIQGLDALRTQITATPVPARRRLPQVAARRGMIRLSAAAAAVMATVATVVGLTLSATSPVNAYAAAKKALAATSAAVSGTMTQTVVHRATTWVLTVTKWNGDDIAMYPGKGRVRGQKQQIPGRGSLFGLPRELLLIGGGAYLQTADGSWRHYATESEVGPRLGPILQLAHDNVAGNTAGQVLALTRDLHSTKRPDGTTLYTGTIPNSSTDTGISPTDDAIMRMITNLRLGNESGAPGGYHDNLELQMIVGQDALVRSVSLAFHQHGTNSRANSGPYTWNVTYSQLGSTPSITAPAGSTPAGSGAGPAPATTAAPRRVR
jgi:hypothetical protein